MANENTVTLTLSSYNQIKAENFRLNLFLEHVLNGATPMDGRLIIDPEQVEASLRFCFYERYRKLTQQKEEKSDG